MKFQLKIIDLHWISGAKDDPSDLCLHGRVFIKIGDEIIDGENDVWTVSAGAYRMLETLFDNHIPHSTPEEHLMPCCGHFMFIDEKTDKLIISGCPNGLEWTVLHESDTIRLITDSNTQIAMPFEEYKSIVFEFADKIESFYNKCSPKDFDDDFNRQNFQRFWKDWRKMRSYNHTE